MRLKRLSLHGYKTFASRTDFQFDGGITAVVGPNGSGKSNIADAVRWVLGEQSYNTLRGKRTTDMIFAGSQQRARAGMAQAIITLDNEEGWLPIDYSEIEIGRRAYRSGENEYLLNGQKVRLKDVTELLSNSGLAERTYTIIGQGLVDQALSLRADERRLLFEEAAGVSRYKNKRAETFRRLQETQHNLERVHDILAEIKPRIRSLRTQARRAQVYEQVGNDLRHHLRLWYGYEWEKAKQDVRQSRQLSQLARQAWEEDRQTQIAIQAELDNQRLAAAKLRGEISEYVDQRDRLRDDYEEAKRELAIVLERKKLLIGQLRDHQLELPDLENQREVITAELDKATDELASARADLESQLETINAFRSGFKDQRAEIERWQATIRDLEEKRETALGGIARQEGSLRLLGDQLEERQRALKELQVGESEVTKVDELRSAAEAARAKAFNCSSKLAKNRKETEQEGEQLGRLREELGFLQTELQELREVIAHSQARSELLEQLGRHEANIAGEVFEKVSPIGQFMELVSIPAEYSAAIESALAHRLRTWVVEDEEALWKLANASDGRLSLAARQLIHPPADIAQPDDAEVVDWASGLVDYDDSLGAIVRLLLGRVLIVKNEAAASRLASVLPFGALAATLDGLVVHSGGLIETSQQGGDHGLLARERERLQAAAHLENKRKELNELRAKIAKSRSEENLVEKRLNQLRDDERTLVRLEGEAIEELTALQSKLDHADQQHQYAMSRREREAVEVARISERIDQFVVALEGDRLGVEQLEVELEGTRRKLQALPTAEIDSTRADLERQLHAIQTILSGRQAVVDSRRATLDQIDALINQRQVRKQLYDSQLAQLDIAAHEEKAQQLAEQLMVLDDLLRPARKRIESFRMKIAELEEKLAIGRRGSHELERQLTEARIALNQSESRFDALGDRIRNDLGLVALPFDADQVRQSPLPIRDIVDQLPQVDELPDDIEETIQRFRGQLNRMGAINPGAPAEYDETQNRYDFLLQQVEDLNNTQLQLRTVIDELDELTSREFALTVERVDKEFGGVFTRLFGGGSAQLVLTDPDDLTTSGVDIVARLPGRREQGLALLSGGERSLTAAALIFALLKVSPTPFCVLDEVDAMLDEANINRFRELLSELSKNTQFIVITHNRGTVAAAESVYGVSMGVDSSSQVISIRPEEYVARAAF